MRKTVSLNGEWTVAFDEKNVGKKQGWAKTFPAKSQPVPVPGVWEQVRPNYDGVGWCRRTVLGKKAWANKTLRLRFEAVMYFCEVFLNGESLGTHEGGYTGFEFDVTGKLLPGENDLVLRIINPPMDREIEGFRSGAPLNQGELPVGKTGWYFNFGGIWGGVSLVVTEATRIEDVFVKPTCKDVCVEIELAQRQAPRDAKFEVCCTVEAGGKVVAESRMPATFRKGGATLAMTLKWKNPHLWTTEDPFLHAATIQLLRDGKAIDERKVRFGLREFTIRGGKFLLNSKPIRLRGMLQQGMYPRTLAMPDTPAMARREMKLLKDAGCNFLRAHLRPPGEAYFDLCDEMGILVEAEPGIGWISNHPETERRCASEIEGMIRQARNHASVVFYCLMNEAYHFRGFTMPQIKALTKRLSKAARQLDNTRLLMDTSGGGGSGVDGGTSIFLPNVDETVEMVDAHAYCPMPPRDESLASYRTSGTAGVALFISEYAAPDVPPDYPSVLAKYTPAERKLGLEDYQLHKDFWDSFRQRFSQAKLKGTFGDERKMIREIDRARAIETGQITAAARTNPKLGGLTICQLADASGELFGVADVWRRPKRVYREFAAAMTTPLLAAEVTPRVTREGQPISVRVTLVNDEVLGVAYRATAEILDAKGKAVWSEKKQVKATRAVQTIRTGRIAATLAAGAYTLRTTLQRGSATVNQRDVELCVIAAPSVSTPRIAAWDPQGRVRAALAGLDVTVEPFSNNYRDKSVPVIVDLAGGTPGRVLRREVFGQIKKMVQLGGAAVLLNPEMQLLQTDLVGLRIDAAGMMRKAGYVKKHPVFRGLPTDCIMGYEYAESFPDEWDKAEDVLAAGGEVLMGAFSSHMWTRPAIYFWGAAVYTLPIERGRLLVSLLEQDEVVWPVLLANLIDEAASKIRRGGEEKLLSRCIDPL